MCVLKPASYDVVVVGAGPAGSVTALKCAEKGLNVLLIERESIRRHKPCGGLLSTPCINTLHEDLGLEVPQEVLSSPSVMGMCLVPPSGRKNSRCLRGSPLLNVERDSFDRWLLEISAKKDAQVSFGTEFLGFQKGNPIKVVIRANKKVVNVYTRYLIGADGVNSRVRSGLYPDLDPARIFILQEYCEAQGNLEDFFYMFFKGAISPLYSYIIPKRDHYILGVSTTEGRVRLLGESVKEFKDWLEEDFDFHVRSIKKTESWAIPYGSTHMGHENTILIGDAAGFCNAFSGEGIRFAIKSGVIAAQSVLEAMEKDSLLATVYSGYSRWIVDYVHNTHQLSESLDTDLARENYVCSQKPLFIDAISP